MNKKIVVPVAATLILITGIVFYKENLYKKVPAKSVSPETTITQIKLINVTQFIFIDPDHPLEQTVEIESNQTALALLSKTNKVETTGTGKNAFITAINKRVADKSKHEFWAFYVNGKQAQVGAGSYTLHQSDKIEWKIETY